MKNILLKCIVWFNNGKIYYKNEKQYVQLHKVMGIGRTGYSTFIDYEVRYFFKIPILFPVNTLN